MMVWAASAHRICDSALDKIKDAVLIRMFFPGES
jgi:hypothetical protein